MTLRHKITPVLAALLAVSALPSSAQYLWIDNNGIKQLSDRPPPPSVPASRIIKAPRTQPLRPDALPGPSPADPAGPSETAVYASTTNAAQPTDPISRRAPTLAEREAAFNRRRAEAAAADQKSAADAQRRADIAANCDAARQNQRTLDQGIRIANIDKAGEPAIMSDQERAEFGKKNQKVLAGCQ